MNRLKIQEGRMRTLIYLADLEGWEKKAPDDGRAGQTSARGRSPLALRGGTGSPVNPIAIF